MGTPSYATVIFQALLNAPDIEVCALFTQSDKKAGRGQALVPPDIKRFALENKIAIDIFQPQTLKDEQITAQITSLKPDFIVVAAYGKLLPTDILDIAPCINLHASLLPKYRGASPIQQAVLNGERYIGVTAMKMEKGLDTGDMLGLSYVLAKGLSSDALFDLLAKKAADLTLKVLRSYDKILPLKQVDALSSKTSKITKEMGLISFELTCEEFERKLLAFTPWPGLFLQSGLKLKSLRCVKAEHSFKAGEIVEIREGEVITACIDGFAHIQTVQAPSKQETDALSYINGKRIRVGDTFY
ncbi:MAG: methionyl-tRNA formyltransferase [Campylobacteraceae bacterium]|nr:methionyl-tRNA formyltransferase [Campylobacteraceae bacterium]